MVKKNKKLDIRLKIGIQAAQNSGKIIKKYFKKIKEKNIKNNIPRDLVTKVDLLSEIEIKKNLLKNFPQDNFLGEETKHKKIKKKFTWVVDPLDGTVNYFREIPLFSISISLFYKKQCVLGIVYDPIQDEMYYAVKNFGAFLNGSKINVSNNNSLKDSLIIFAFPSELKNKNKIMKIFANLNFKSMGVLRIGSAALALAYLASGKIDGYIGYKNKIWDIAAGKLIIEEAQGKTSDENNFDYKYKNYLICSNKKIHHLLISEMK